MVNDALSVVAARPFRGWAKWRQVLFHVLLAAAGVALIAIWATQVDPVFVPMRVLAGYTAYAVALTLLLAGALAMTRQLPTLEWGGSGAVLRSFRPEFWYDNALDAGLALIGGWLAVLALVQGGELVVPGLLVGVAGLWFLVPVLLAATGLRRNDALTVSADEVAVAGKWGVARAPRASVRQVDARGASVLIRLTEASHETLVLRPWRGQVGSTSLTLVFDCSMTGHDPRDLARWLGAELGVTQDARR